MDGILAGATDPRTLWRDEVDSHLFKDGDRMLCNLERWTKSGRTNAEFGIRTNKWNSPLTCRSYSMPSKGMVQHMFLQISVIVLYELSSIMVHGSDSTCGGAVLHHFLGISTLLMMMRAVHLPTSPLLPRP
jgi:hypothetical protein